MRAQDVSGSFRMIDADSSYARYILLALVLILKKSQIKWSLLIIILPKSMPERSGSARACLWFT